MSTDDTEFFPVDETLRRQFEAAWVAGAPQPIERFLPDHQHPNFLATLEELVHVLKLFLHFLSAFIGIFTEHRQGPFVTTRGYLFEVAPLLLEKTVKVR